MAGATPFTITVGGGAQCVTKTGFQVFFEGASNVNTAGRIVAGGSATGVTLALLNSDRTVINANANTGPLQGVQAGLLTGTTTKTGAQSFLVGYHAVNASAVTAGTVTGSINYSVTYQ